MPNHMKKSREKSYLLKQWLKTKTNKTFPLCGAATHVHSHRHYQTQRDPKKTHHAGKTVAYEEPKRMDNTGPSNNTQNLVQHF